MSPADDSEEELLDELLSEPPQAVRDEPKKASLTHANIKERFKTSMQCKEVGNGAYFYHHWKKAIDCWTTAQSNMQDLKDDGQLDDADESRDRDDLPALAKVQELQTWLNMHLAQAHLKDGNFHSALGFCEAVLAQEGTGSSEYLQAMYRKAYALLMASNFSESRVTLGLLLETNPDNEAAKTLLQTVNKKERTAKVGEKKAALKMFAAIDDPRSMEQEQEVAPPQKRPQQRAWYYRLGCCPKRKHS